LYNLLIALGNQWKQRISTFNWFQQFQKYDKNLTSDMSTLQN
jgi:hypothetical protein